MINERKERVQPEGYEIPKTSRYMLLLTCALLILYLVIDIVAQILPPHYSPIRDAESDLAVGPYGFLMTVNFVNRGVLSILFLTGISLMTSNYLRNSISRSLGFALIGIWAVGAFLLAVFPTNVPATPITIHGFIHLITAIISFIAGGTGTYFLTRSLPANIYSRKSARAFFSLSGLTILFLLVDLILPFVLSHLAARIGGLTERLFLGSLLLWMFIVSYSSYQLNPNRHKDSNRSLS